MGYDINVVSGEAITLEIIHKDINTLNNNLQLFIFVFVIIAMINWTRRILNKWKRGQRDYYV